MRCYFVVDDHFEGNMKQKKKEFVLLIVFNIFLLIYGLIHINKMYGLTIGVDDFGYIGTAEYFSGLQWDNLFSNISYYSFGYSFLLYFIVRAFSDPIVIFRTIVILNVLLVVFSYNLAISVFSLLNSQREKKHIIVECFCVSLYSSVFIYTNFALTECLLYFLFWLILWLLLRVPDNNILGYGLVALLIVYAFFVHQRCIMLFFALAFFFVIKTLKREMKISRALFFGAFFVLFLGAGFLLKEFLMTNLYVSNESVGVNNVSGQVKKIEYLFTWEGLLVFLSGLASKYFYLLVSTFLSIGMGTYILLVRVINYLKNEKNGKGEGVIVFIFLSFIFTMLLQAFFLIYPNRPDMVIYGRYVEFLIGPVILFGLEGLYMRIKYKMISIFYIFTVICAQVTKYLFQKFELASGASYLSPGVFSLYARNKDLCETTDIAVIVILIFVFLVIVFHKVSERFFHRNGFIFCLILCALLWGYNVSEARRSIIEEQNTLYTEYLPMAEILKDSEKKIGFIVDTAESDEKRIRAIQFFVGSRKIERLEFDKLDSYTGEYIILLSKGTNTYSQIDKGKIIFQNYRYALFEA